MGMGSRLGGGGRLGMLKRFALGMGGKSGVPLVWLLYDKFTTADAAPITSPRTCEPGPGTLTIVDTGNNADIAGGELVYTGVTGNGDPRASGDLSGSITSRSSGVGVAGFFDYSLKVAGRTYFGFHDADVTLPTDQVIHHNGAAFYALDENNSITIDSTFFVSEQSYRSLIVQRSLGEFFVVDGKLYWVGTISSAVDDTIIFSARTAAADTRVTTIGALSLPANGYSAWDGDFSEVTDTKTNPANLTTYNSEANFHINYTFTHEAGQKVDMFFREVDSSNYVWFEIRADGTSKLRYKVGGVTSTPYSSGVIYSDGVATDMDIVCDGSSVKVYKDKVLLTSSTITAHSTQTGGSVHHDLVSNDIVLTTHPNPALGIATDRVIAPQAADTATHTTDFLAYMRGITVPSAGSLQYDFRGTP